MFPIIYSSISFRYIICIWRQQWASESSKQTYVHSMDWSSRSTINHSQYSN